MPASHETHDPGPVSTPRGAPVLVAVVAGTKTRIKVLEKLLNQPGVVLAGSAQDPSAAEELVLRVGLFVVGTERRTHLVGGRVQDQSVQVLE